jgi:hypothetical protein
VDGHVEPIEHQDATGQGADGGGRGGVLDNNAPASRAMHPRRVRIGCLKPLHVPPPELCQSPYCSRFFWRIPARTAKIQGRSIFQNAHCRRRLPSPIVASKAENRRLESPPTVKKLIGPGQKFAKVALSATPLSH